jgi:hypothetical protein
MQPRWLFFPGFAVLWLFAFLQIDDADYRQGNPVVPWILFYGISGLVCALAALRRLPDWLVTGMIGAALAFLALSLPGAWFMLRGQHDIGLDQAMEWGAMTSLAEYSFVEQFREAGGALIVLALLVCARIWGVAR